MLAIREGSGKQCRESGRRVVEKVDRGGERDEDLLGARQGLGFADRSRL
jgi:hypothetical protein